MSIAVKVSKWITEQEEKGMTRDEISKTLLIDGDSVIKLKKASGNKFNIEITCGCVRL